MIWPRRTGPPPGSEWTSIQSPARPGVVLSVIANTSRVTPRHDPREVECRQHANRCTAPVDDDDVRAAGPEHLPCRLVQRPAGRDRRGLAVGELLSHRLAAVGTRLG